MRRSAWEQLNDKTRLDRGVFRRLESKRNMGSSCRDEEVTGGREQSGQQNEQRRCGNGGYSGDA